MPFVQTRPQFLKSIDKKFVDLSKAKRIDYRFLSHLLERTSFIETLVLPRISKKNAEDMLKVLNESTAKNTTITEIKFAASEFGNELPKHIVPLYEKIKSHLHRNRERIFAIHGGGNIGLGCMADIVARSPYNYYIIGTSSDHFTNGLINCAHRYCLQNNTNKHLFTCIQNVSMMYSRDADNIIKLYKEANLLALCLTEEAFLQVVTHIAQGLIARYEYDAAELKILILMNKPNCEKFVRKHIAKALLTQTKQQEYADEVLSKVQFIPTVVDRIVTKINRKNLLNQMKQQLIAIDKLYTNKFLDHYDFVETRKPFAQQIDKIISTPEKLTKAIVAFNLHFAPFNVEPNFTLHIQDGLPEAKRIPMIKTVKNLDQFAAIKNKFINGPHAILAWIGGLMGCHTIAEAIRKPSLVTLIKIMMEKEIGPILKAEYPALSNDELKALKQAFIKRCEISVDDPISRVGRDPLRKLNSGGRVRGVIELCQKHHMQIETPELERGIAAGILYAVKNVDPENPECQKIREIYEQNHSYEAILCYKGPYGDGKYPGFEPNKDKNIIRNVLKKIKMLEKTFSVTT